LRNPTDLLDPVGINVDEVTIIIERLTLTNPVLLPFLHFNMDFVAIYCGSIGSYGLQNFLNDLKSRLILCGSIDTIEFIDHGFLDLNLSLGFVHHFLLHLCYFFCL